MIQHQKNQVDRMIDMEPRDQEQLSKKDKYQSHFPNSNKREQDLLASVSLS